MNKKLITYLLILLPIVVFYVFVFQNAFNIGWNDDWHGIEGFLASWMQQVTVSDKITLLFSQMCEHRILYVRLSTLLSYHLFGEVNYKTMMLMGVAYLLILPFVFYRVLREINVKLAYLIPIIFIIFNTQPIENIFWAITSLQPNTVIIFGLWGFSLLLFYQKKWAFYLANFLFFLAMFTNGNGMFAFIAAIPK
jgi:ABC-type enterochelin transport system permease subunit